MEKRAPRIAELPAAKLHLLAERLWQKAPPRQQPMTIPRRSDPSSKVPASFAQERMYFLYQWEPSSPAFNIPLAVRFTGKLNLAALERSVNEIIRRHETMRTSFQSIDGQVYQLIAPASTRPLPLLDLQSLSQDQREAEARRLAVSEFSRPFDLSQGPPWRLSVLRLDPGEHVVLFSMHHIMGDGWSLRVIVQELGALYQAFRLDLPSPLPDPPLQYADFAQWQRQYLRGARLDQLLSYWRRQLGGERPALNLPTDYPRQTIRNFRGANCPFVLSPSLHESLKILNRQEDITMFMSLLAGFIVLLQRYTRGHDISVGTNIANRNFREIEGLIGFFVNNLVIRTDLSGELTFRDLLRRVRQVTLDAYAHQDLPFEMLTEAVRSLWRDQSSPLFQVMFIFQNVPIPVMQMPDVSLSPFDVDYTAAPFDLSLYLQEDPQGLRGWVNYRTDLFDAATIVQMAGHFNILLEGLVTSPDQYIGEAALSQKNQASALVHDFNEALE